MKDICNENIMMKEGRFDEKTLRSRSCVARVFFIRIKDSKIVVVVAAKLCTFSQSL